MGDLFYYIPGIVGASEAEAAAAGVTALAGEAEEARMEAAVDAAEWRRDTEGR